MIGQAPRVLAAVAASLTIAQALSACGSSNSSPAGTVKTSSKGASGSSLNVVTTPRYAAPSPSSPVRAGVVEIAYRNITIRPDTVRVRVGSTVRWTNFDPVEHNVTSQSNLQHFSSGNFGEGKTYEIRVTRPGVIHYLCTIHPATMNGTIEVVR